MYTGSTSCIVRLSFPQQCCRWMKSSGTWCSDILKDQSACIFKGQGVHKESLDLTGILSYYNALYYWLDYKYHIWNSELHTEDSVVTVTLYDRIWMNTLHRIGKCHVAKKSSTTVTYGRVTLNSQHMFYGPKSFSFPYIPAVSSVITLIGTWPFFACSFYLHICIWCFICQQSLNASVNICFSSVPATW